MSESPQGCQLQLQATSDLSGQQLSVTLGQGSFTATANMTIWSPISLDLQPETASLGALVGAAELAQSPSCADSKFQVGAELCALLRLMASAQPRLGQPAKALALQSALFRCVPMGMC